MYTSQKTHSVSNSKANQQNFLKKINRLYCEKRTERAHARAHTHTDRLSIYLYIYIYSVFFNVKDEGNTSIIVFILEKKLHGLQRQYLCNLRTTYCS